MKRLLYAVVTVFACVAAYQAVAHNSERAQKRDWKREAALMANDLPTFLHYHPTDGASYEGQVRKAMDPANVQP